MDFGAASTMVVVVSVAVIHVEAIASLAQRVRQKPSSQTWRQMRSALAGTASNVAAVKTAAAVPMNVIERMFHSIGDRRQRWTITRVSRNKDHLNFDTQNIF